MNPMHSGALVIIGGGVVITLVAIPLALGKVRRNHWYGVRLPRAFVSEANWEAINRYGGKVLICYGAAVSLLGLVLLLPLPFALLVSLPALPLILLAPVLLLIFRFARRLPDA